MMVVLVMVVVVVVILGNICGGGGGGEVASRDESLDWSNRKAKSLMQACFKLNALVISLLVYGGGGDNDSCDGVLYWYRNLCCRSYGSSVIHL